MTVRPNTETMNAAKAVFKWSQTDPGDTATGERLIKELCKISYLQGYRDLLTRLKTGET